jgi:hypothetical protein
MFCGISEGQLPHLKPLRLEGGVLWYVCTEQGSGQWLIKVIDNHRLGSGARLKAVVALNLPKPDKVALLCDCEALANLIFRHLGCYIMEPDDYL